MKILFCTNTYDNLTNGPTKFIQSLEKRLDSIKNVELKILSEDIDIENSDLLKCNVPTFWKNNPLGNIVRMIQYYRHSRRIFKFYKYDYIVYNNAFIGLLTCLLDNSRFIGFVNDYSNARPDRGLRHHEFIKRKVFREVEKIVCRKSRIIVNSSFLKKILVEQYELKGSNVFILNKGLELTSLKVVKQSTNFQGIREGSIRILFVKADFFMGGLDVLIQALKLSKYEYVLEVIGPRMIDEPIIKDWTCVASNVELSFKGPLPNEQVYQRMRANDFFIVPSRKEAFGLANVEAMSLGCPVISVPTGGIPEVLDYGRAGFLSSSAKPEDLMKIVEFCIENPLEVERRVTFALEYVARYEFSRVTEKFIDILKC